MDAKIRNPTENAIYKFTKNGAKKECILKNASAFQVKRLGVFEIRGRKYIFATAYSVPLSSSSEREYRNEKTI